MRHWSRGRFPFAWVVPCAALLAVTAAAGDETSGPSFSFAIPAREPFLTDAVDVDVDGMGNVFILMGGQVNELIKVDASGRILWEVGRTGSSLAQFKAPEGVAVDPAGRVYVVDRYNSRVQYFDSSGAFLGTFGSHCDLSAVHDLGCIDPDGDGPLEAGDGQFLQPIDVAVDAAGRIYVADLNNRIQVFSAPGVLAFKFGSICVLDPGYPDHQARCVDPDGPGPLVIGDGQFNSPKAVAIDPGGRILVADGNNRVQVFDSAGHFQFMLGKDGGSGASGSGHGEFYFPTAVAADASGRIIVGDGIPSVRPRIQIFSPSGEFESEFESFFCTGSCPDDPLEGVQGLAVHGTGTILVADSALHYLVGLSPDGQFRGTFGNFRSDQGFFRYTSDVAVASDGRIYAKDGADFGRIQVFDPSGAFLTSIQNQYTSLASSIAVGPDGRLYLSRGSSDTVSVLSPTGQHLLRVGTDAGARCDLWTGAGCIDPDGPGPRQPGDGQFVNQTGVAVDSGGRIYVADTGNHRVQVFDTAGRFLFKFGRGGGDGSWGRADGEFFGPYGIAADAMGRIYVADTGNGRIQVFDATGGFLFKINEVGGAVDVAVDDLGRIYAVDPDRSLSVEERSEPRVRVFNASGAFLYEFGGYGLTPGRFRSPTGVAVGPDGRVVVADDGNNRVQVFHDLIADVSLTIQGPPAVAPGAVVAYVIHVINHGPATAKRVAVTTVLPPAGVSRVGDLVETSFCTAENGQTTCGGTFDSDVCSGTGRVVTCTLGDLPEDGVGTVTLFVRVAPGPSHTLTMEAMVGMDMPDLDSSNNDGVVITTMADVTPPELRLPADTTKEATSPAGAVVVYVATASDDVDGRLDVLCTPPSGATFALGRTDVACGAADAAGHSVSGSFAVTVVDTTPPSLVPPKDLVAEATGPSTSVALGSPVVSDRADPEPTATTGASGPFTLGTHVILWTAVDASGNTATATQTVTVQDGTSPTITIVSPSSTAYTLGEPVAASYGCADAASGIASCGGPVPSGAGLDTSSVGARAFTVEAADGAGNSASKSISYTVAYGACLLYDPGHAKKSGSTVPIKIQLCDAQGRNVSRSDVVVTALELVKLSDSTTAEVVETGDATPDRQFRFDTTLGAGGGYRFNLKTTGLSTGTYALTWAATGDASVHGSPVTFQIK